MVLGKTVIWDGAEELELKSSHNVELNPACVAAIEQLLLDVFDVSCPKQKDYYNRCDLIRIFNIMAKEIYGSGNGFPVVEALGSFLMDVFSVESDLDLSINFSNNSVEFPREKKVPALRKLARRLYLLQSQGHVYRVHPIVSAKVPIVKVIDRGTGIECDISVENKDGILKSQIIRIISTIDHRFQKLSVLMKTWAKVRSINSSKDHTLNSLSIILLVAFHLQTREPPILPPFRVLLKDGMEPAKVKKVVQGYLQYGKGNNESLAELFVSLLSKLASVESLWLEGICASAYEGTWIDRIWEDGRMNVEDFTDRTENVARAVGKAGIKQIYRCIHCSLGDISAFNYGRIDALKLKACLFDAGKAPAHLNRKKRNRALASSSAVVARKKSCSAEGSNPWEEGIKAIHDVQWKNCSTKSSNPWEEGNLASSNDSNWKNCSAKSSNPWGEGNQATTEIHGSMPHSSSSTKKANVVEGSNSHLVNKESGLLPDIPLLHCPPKTPPALDHGWRSWGGMKHAPSRSSCGWRSWGGSVSVPRRQKS